MNSFIRFLYQPSVGRFALMISAVALSAAVVCNRLHAHFHPTQDPPTAQAAVPDWETIPHKEGNVSGPTNLPPEAAMPQDFWHRGGRRSHPGYLRLRRAAIAPLIRVSE
jgi:hypothetical protein